MTDSKPNFWFTSNGLAAMALIGAVVYFLLTEHRAHFFYALPYLIILLCPVMHLFMHRGHGGHGGHSGQGSHAHRSHNDRHDGEHSTPGDSNPDRKEDI